MRQPKNNSRYSDPATIFRQLFQHQKSFSNHILQHLDPYWMKIILLMLSVPAIWFVGDVIIVRHLWPHKYFIAAGLPDGESNILSKALNQAVQNDFCKYMPYCNITIQVVETQGTKENLALLEGKIDNKSLIEQTLRIFKDTHAIHADFATVQSDIFSADTKQQQTSKALAVAVLYEDTFQLLVKESSNIKNFETFISELNEDSPKEISVPSNGGQEKSFENIAKHFERYNRKDYRFVTTSKTEICNSTNNNIYAIFRVRLIGNKEIYDALKCGWKLLPIKQGIAMKRSYPAFEPTKINIGAYQGDRITQQKELLNPVPDQDIETIAVKRILLARKDVPDWLSYELTKILNRNSSQLVNVLKSDAQKLRDDAKNEEAEKIEKNVIPLISNIANLNKPEQIDSIGITLHPGARNLYEPQAFLSSEFFKWTAALSSCVTVIGFIISRAWDLNKQFKVIRKNEADKYIEETTALMKSGLTKTSPANTQVPIANEKAKIYKVKFADNEVSELPPDNKKLDLEQILELNIWVYKLEQLIEIFNRAQKSLYDEVISEESFRTFAETYKTARDFIEEKIQASQRVISSHYINQAMSLLNKKSSLEDLDKIRDEAARILIKDHIFSRESFRTFIEAYNLVKGAIQ